MEKSQSQNAIVGLAHHRFWSPQRKLISCHLLINFYVRMCVRGHIKLSFCFRNQKSQYQSQCLRLMMVSVSVSIFDTEDKSLSISPNFWDQCIKSQSQSQNLIQILKFSVSVTKFDTNFKSLSHSINKQGIAETAKTNGPTCDKTCIQKI